MPVPIKSIRSCVAPGVQVSIWEGEKGCNFSIKKSYQNKAGEWVDATTFYPADLAALKECIGQALAYVDELRASRPKQGRTEQAVERAVQRAEAQPAAESAFDDDDIPF